MWGFQQGFQWWMPLFGMGMMLFWLVVVGLGVWAFRRSFGSSSDSTEANDTPINILRTRLARGEITKEQFEELQDSLRGTVSSA